MIQHYQMVKVAIVPVEAPGGSVSCYDGTPVYDSAIYLVTLLQLESTGTGAMHGVPCGSLSCKDGEPVYDSTKLPNEPRHETMWCVQPAKPQTSLHIRAV